MLVLKLKRGKKIVIRYGDDTLTITKGSGTALQFHGPRSFEIARGQALKKEKRDGV
jgi:hypothetical protein